MQNNYYCCIISNMNQVVSITSKGQLHIPISIRSQLKLKTPSQAEIYVEKDKIVVKPKESNILKMGGSLAGIKPTKKINLDRIRDYIDYSEI